MNDRIEAKTSHGFETYWRGKPSRTGLHLNEQREAFIAGVKFGLDLASDIAKETPKKSEKRSEQSKPIHDKEAGASEVPASDTPGV